MIVSLRENKLMVGFVTILVVMLSFVFSGSVHASTPNDESDFEFSNGEITGYTGTSTDVVIPSTIGGVAVTSIGNNAFYNNNLTSVVIPGSVTSISNHAFADNQLTSVVIPGSVTLISVGAFADNQLTSVVIPGSVTSISNYAFAGNNLTSVVIPGSVTSIRDGAFQDNSNLEAVVIEGEPRIVGDVAFSRTWAKSGNTSVTLYGIPNSSVQAYAGNNGHPFRDIVELDFEFDSSTGEITEYVGESTDVVIPSTIGGVAVTSIGDGAFSNNNLTSVTIGNGVRSIGAGAFYNNNLTSVVIPDSVTSIGLDAFSNNNLTSVTIGNGVTSIGNWAFQNNNLTSVTIPDSVTSIEGSAFQNNNLTSVTIPDSVTSIGNSAFRDNSSLETVIIKGEPTIAGTTTFSRTADVSGNTNVTLYGIPNSSVQVYADANGHPFRDLASIVEDTLEGQHNILANILSGGLHLYASPIVNFGEILLGTTKETHYTGFEDNLSIHDLRGSHEGWSLTVSADVMGNEEHEMPVGSLLLGNLESIESQVGEVTTGISEYTGIDGGDNVQVADATGGNGMGVTGINFGEEALGLVVDPKTTRAGQYESTLTWTLEAIPYIE